MKRTVKRTTLTLTVFAIAASIGNPNQARADSIPVGWKSGSPTIATFNFDSNPLGTSTGFSDTNNGITATFSSTADPGGFTVVNSFFLTLFNHVLIDPGPARTSNIPLTIDLSRTASAVALVFATSSPGTLTLTAFDHGTKIGSVTSIGLTPAGFSNPEGTVSFIGTFDSLTLSATTPNFAIDNLNFAIPSAITPESSSLFLMGLGFALLITTRTARKYLRKTG